MGRLFLKHLMAVALYCGCACVVFAHSNEGTESVAKETQADSGSAERPNSAEIRADRVAQAVKGIISYVRWPQALKDPQLCVVGPTEYADALLMSTPVTQTDNDRLSVRRVLLPDMTAEVAQGCASVYIGKLDRVDQILLLKKLVGKPILSIVEDLPQCSNGSLFCLRIADDRVGFEVNLDSVARSGLRVNPQVLKLGRATGTN